VAEKRLYLFDVDGTLVTSYMNKLHPREEYMVADLLPKRAPVIERLAAEGASFALISNQGGVPLGYQTEQEAWQKAANVVAALSGFHGRPVSIHLCFDPPQNPSERRKPEPGMLREAFAAHRPAHRPGWHHKRQPAAHRDYSLYIGDEPKDREAAERAGVDFDDAEHFFHHAVRLHEPVT
jgi:histidinol phosphatase-like enzyme